MRKPYTQPERCASGAPETATSPNRPTAMALPLHEQLSHENWRRMINEAGPGDLEGLRKIAGTILDWGIAQRAFAMEQARFMLPTAEPQQPQPPGPAGRQ